MMFNKYLKQTNSKTVEYFEKLFSKYFKNEKNIPNSIILWGSDSLAQYFFALEIARELNCKNDRVQNCDCLSCRWIYNNEHPEIKTISKIDSKPSGDETKNISVKQVGELLLDVSKKSSDYRVVIFCDADYEKISSEQIAQLENYGELKTAIKNDGEKYWIPKPLNSKVLQDESANALLKTIEETPDKLLFIFLTASPNDLISTIVSRSQMFYIQNTSKKNYDFSFFKDIFKNYPNIKKEDFLYFTEKMLAYMKENDIGLFECLENMQAYFTELLKSNYSDNQIRSKILQTIENIIQAKKYKQAVIKDEYILDDFFFFLS